MFTYLHCYLPETWDAQVEAGLIGKNSGIRLVQGISVPEEKKFNNLAAKDGKLYKLLQEHRIPFYIDRLLGGNYYENYNYDMALVEEYRKLLGDNFWGFQMHEWMSNYRDDFTNAKNGGCTSWTAEGITEAIFRVYPYPYLLIAGGTPAEMAEDPYPHTLEDFIFLAEKLFAKRQRYTGGSLIPCDSYYMAAPIELKLGAKRLMPEVGAQIPDTRIQMAYTRGMARSAGIPYGAYTEPWQGVPPTTCCFQRDGLNEWGIGGSEDFPFHPEGENGGSSRSMQMRMQLYTYMAGVSFLSEEWGMCNTFYDWKDFQLSPYGKVKYDFIRFTERHPDIGTPLTPVAVVLPKELPALSCLNEPDGYYLSYPVTGALAHKVSTVKKGLTALFRDTDPMLGNPYETATLPNCRLPDVLDIVNEDHLDGEAYPYLIDLTGSPSLAARYPGKICDIRQLPELLDKLLPCKITGSAMKQINRNEDGSYYIMLLNNSGVERSVAEGESLLRAADSTVTVQPKPGLTLEMLEGNAAITNTESSYHVHVPAGGWFFGKLKQA